jgi:hypothetical protein
MTKDKLISAIALLFLAIGFAVHWFLFLDWLVLVWVGAVVGVELWRGKYGKR